MTARRSLASAFAVATIMLAATAVGTLGRSDNGLQAAAGPQRDSAGGQADDGFELWMADQSDTRQGYGGQLLIYAGSDLMGRAAREARPVDRLDLGAETADLCRASTGRNPVRPHMILFNDRHTHAVLSFVASGHVVIFDAVRRRPLTCIETTLGTTGTRQAHAAFPAPDGSYILVANQNGKRLERIDTDYASNTFTHNAKATLDLGTCTTPSGAPCEAPDLRPVNWPICPIIDSSSRYGFVTLRGGGLFVVDARATPMAIVAEYDKKVVRGNGCGGVEVRAQMFLNSGGSPVNVSGSDPHHPDLYGFDVYRFPLTSYSPRNPPNTPKPDVLLSKSGMSDSHGVVATRADRYLWVMDRHANVAEIIDTGTGKRVNTVDLRGVSDDPAPDLADRAPNGERLFVALRGPVPLSGDPHNATGTTPGLGIIEVAEGGRTGKLMTVVPLINPSQQAGQAPDAHGLRVRLTKGR
jgi:hypothetical protein